MNRQLLSTGLITAVVTSLLCGMAQAAFPPLAQRLPPSTNAIVAVNIENLVQSPYGKESQWDQRLAESWAKQPLMIPPGSRRVIMGADVKPSSMESYWEMSLILMDQLPTLESLAKDEGGQIDRVWDTNAVYSPINAYFVPLPGNILASITPAERSQIAKWVRQPVQPEGVVTSQYISKVLSALTEQTDIVMAMDLEGAYGVPNIRKWLDENQIKEIQEKDLPETARVLGSMKGITLEVRVETKINGKATVHFDRPAAILKDSAKPIMLSLLNYVGMNIDEMPQWTFSVSGTELTMQGDLGDASLRRLLSVVQSPIPATTVAERPAGATSAAPADPAKASQKYFKSVCAILDSAQGGKSLADSATWIRSASKRIDQLPILNVDPALLEWGGMVSSRLKQVGATLAVGQTQTSAQVASVMAPQTSSYSYDYDGNATPIDTAADRAARENANLQRRQAAMQQKAQAQDQAAKILNDIAETRPKIRAEMTQKYQVEF